MAEDKKKDGDAKAPESKPKKGKSPLIFLAVGAIAGGAGAVFALPPKPAQAPPAAIEHAIVDVKHPDLIDIKFNPRTQAGKSYAQLSFRFVYRVREDREEAAFETIKANWDRGRSACLFLLKARTMSELTAENGPVVLAQELVEELDHVLFPGQKHEKVATVTEVMFQEFILQ
jgi:flagellar basal body-associated protein FliL